MELEKNQTTQNENQTKKAALYATLGNSCLIFTSIRLCYEVESIIDGTCNGLTCCSIYTNIAYD